MTYVDIGMMDALRTLEKFTNDVKKRCPCLFSLKERIENYEKIKAWIDKRPVTEF